MAKFKFLVRILPGLGILTLRPLSEESLGASLAGVVFFLEAARAAFFAATGAVDILMMCFGS